MYRSLNKAVFSAKYHLVWCPKYHGRVLFRQVEERLNEIIVQVVGELGREVIELEVISDHVYLVVEVPPAVPLSKLVRLPKDRSSRFLRRQLPALRDLPVLWSPSWFVSTVGGAPLEVVRRHHENHKQAA